VVLAAGGYPGDYAKGDVINGLDAAAKIEGKVFHAGTALKDGKGDHQRRACCATAMGSTVADAQQQAYRLAKEVSWNGSFYRSDIGYRAIARERGEHQQKVHRYAVAVSACGIRLVDRARNGPCLRLRAPRIVSTRHRPEGIS
jgi:hypothetical protein